MIEAIKGLVEGLGFELVDLKKGSGKRARLQVRIDVTGSEPGNGVTVDQCAAVSRAIEAWLDEGGELGENYVLEVSSPGIERPVRWPEHWERYVGRNVKLRVPERGRVTAKIVGVSGEDVELEIDGELVVVGISEKLNATLAVDWSEIG